MKTFITVGLLTLSITVSAAKKNPIVAQVGKRKITLSEFKQTYKKLDTAYNKPPATLFLEDLVRFEVGIQEARKLKLQNDPVLKQRMREEMYKLLLEKKLGKKVQNIKVNEKEMRREYKRNPELRTSHILFEYKPGATKKQIAITKKRATEIYNEIKKSKRPFEELVKLYTDDGLSKNTGGDIGYLTRVTAVPPYYEAALKLKVNQISRPIRTRYGFHIIKLTGKRTFAQADRRKIRAIVFETKRKKIFNDYFRKLKKNYKISTNKNALKGIN